MSTDQPPPTPNPDLDRAAFVAALQARGTLDAFGEVLHGAEQSLDVETREAWWRELRLTGQRRDATQHKREERGGQQTRWGGLSAKPTLRQLVAQRVYGVAIIIAIVAMLLSWGEPNSRLNNRVAHIYSTSTGQRATVILREGTKVILAPQTRLTTRQGFIELDGEAYFDVTHHANAPVRVRTGSVLTQVLGTRFDIAHYQTDDHVRVVVMQGKVMTGGGRRVMLAAGQQAHITDSTAVVSPMSDASRFAAWTHGQLEFREVPIPTVLETLERWYDMKFRLADASLSKLHLTATLDYGSTTDLLDVLSTLLDVTPVVDRTRGTPIVTLHLRAHATTPGRHSLRDSLTLHSELGR